MFTALPFRSRTLLIVGVGILVLGLSVFGTLFFSGDVDNNIHISESISLLTGPEGEGMKGVGVGACSGSCPCGTTCTSFDAKGGGCFSYRCVACPPDPPTASLSASPTSIENGDSSTLTWSSSGDVDSCTSDDFATGGATSGSTDVSPSSDTTYTVTCTGPDGSDDDSATVNVFAPIVATLTASPSLITNGESSTLTWSSSGDATSCSGSGFATGGATSGSTDVSPTENTTYVVLCEGPAGSDTDTDDVEVSNPSAPPEIDADPARVEREDTTSISWDENGHLGCSISATNGDSINVASSSPQTSDTIFGETTYTISCSDDGSSDSATVTIIPEFEEF